MNAPAHIRHLAQMEDGAVLVLFAMALVAFLGLVALTVDFGRAVTTQSELQSFADNVALAAAGELDGKADSITRATAAAANLISDSQTYAEGSKALGGAQDYSLSFYSSLPGSDTASMAAFQTTDPAKAAYVRVVVNDRTVITGFMNAFNALTGATGQDNIVTSAHAVAGFTQYACDITPLMFCLPHPGYKAEDHVGAMILLRSGGQGAAWGPGDFGFLDPAKFDVDSGGPCKNLTGVKLDACLIGAEGSITQCFSQRGVDIEPGQKVGIENAVFNIRFDMYGGIMNGKKNDPAYAPAPNVVKGIKDKNGKACIQNDEVANTAALPRDDCFASGNCGRIGDGTWSAGRTAYVSANYGGTDPHPQARTRYAYYLAELAAAGGAASTNPILTGAGLDETGRPQCSANKSNDPERRTVVAAGIDCTANPINGAATDVPVEEFFRLFLTEPVGSDGASPPTLNLYAEIVGTAEATGNGSGSSGLFHDVVQLYR